MVVVSQMNTPMQQTSSLQVRSRRSVTKDKTVVDKEDQIMTVLGLYKLVEIGSK
jgi:hypothetical protein